MMWPRGGQFTRRVCEVRTLATKSRWSWTHCFISGLRGNNLVELRMNAISELT